MHRAPGLWWQLGAFPATVICFAKATFPQGKAKGAAVIEGLAGRAAKGRPYGPGTGACSSARRMMEIS